MKTARCDRLDGFSTLRVQGSSAASHRVQVEWAALGQRGWTADVLSPIGNRIVELNWNGEVLGKSGEWESVLQPLSVGQDGFLLWDGWSSGIKVGEIPCILGLKIPRSWKKEPVEVSLKTGDIFIRDHGRQILLRKASKRQNSAPASCADVSWSQLLGAVSHTWEWCGLNHSVGSLKMPDKWVISWQNL